MRTYKCVICGVECQSRDKRSVLCKSKECFRKFSNDRYSGTLFEKECSHCHKHYNGTYRETLCSECKDIPKTFSHLSTNREYKCVRCGIVLGVASVIKMGRYKADKSTNRNHLLCDECIRLSRNKLRDCRMGDRNPNWRGGSKHRSVETPEQTSKRMRDHNPMHNPTSVVKMKATIAERIANGGIVIRRGRPRNVTYKTGKDHHLWKGNRKRSQVIRSRLYSTWILPQMKLDNFRCSECGKSKCRLEVHHSSEKFSDILSKFCTVPLENLTDAEFEVVSRQVVDYHTTLVRGKTVCVECHKRIDPNRK